MDNAERYMMRNIIAAMSLNGLLSNPQYPSGEDTRITTEDAFLYAELFMEKLDEEKEDG